MPLQDLTPQLRTRLRRVEKVVGWFVTLAFLVLLGGFAFYLYTAAQKRGWFETKINYATSLSTSSGLNVGDPVRLLGFPVGEVTRIVPNEPTAARGVTVFFNVRKDPEGTEYYGYIWWDSKVRVVSDFLGKSYLEIEKGVTGQPSVYAEHGILMAMNRRKAGEKFKKMLVEAQSTNSTLSGDALTNLVTSELMQEIKSHREIYYTNAIAAGFSRAIPPGGSNYYWIPPIEGPALQDRLDAIANTVEKAVPNILNLTNQLAAVLSNANLAVVQLNSTIAQAHPTLTNLAIITGHLRDPNGSLGNWLLPTNIVSSLDTTLRTARETLQSARTTIDSTDTNVTMLATDLDKTLIHLSDLTSNLAWQVQINTNLVSEISTTIVHTDDLIQGLKREWFLRGAFKKKAVKPAGQK